MMAAAFGVSFLVWFLGTVVSLVVAVNSQWVNDDDSLLRIFVWPIYLPAYLIRLAIISPKTPCFIAGFFASIFKTVVERYSMIIKGE